MKKYLFLIIALCIAIAVVFAACNNNDPSEAPSTSETDELPTENTTDNTTEASDTSTEDSSSTEDDTSTEDNTTTGDSEECAHDWEAADCNTPKTCKNCYTTEGEKLEHDIINHSAKAPTCTEIGWDAYEMCGRCNYSTYVEQAALDHDIVEHTAKTPTCTESGWSSYVTCVRCEYSTFVSLSSTGHSEVSHAAKTPTCTEDGWNAYVTCLSCDYTTYSKIALLGHNYSGDVCLRCGDKKEAPPEMTVPDEKPVDRAEHSPYEYFRCALCGYVAYNDKLNIAGSLTIDSFNPQGSETNYFSGGYQHGKTITLKQSSNGYFDISGWVGVNSDDYTLGWSIGSDDLRWWSYEETKITASNDPNVFAAARRAGYTNASRFTYTLPWVSFISGDVIHLLVKDNTSGLIYCFGEFKVIKSGEKDVAVLGSLDHFRYQSTSKEYKSSIKNNALTITETDGLFELTGWIATSLSDYSLVWRLNEELREGEAGGYKTSTGDDVVKAASNLGYNYSTRFKYYFPPEAIRSGDTVYLYIKDNSTGALYMFAAYTVNISETASQYDLLNTIIAHDPVQKENVSAPYDDASLKMWFDHLTEKVSRYDTSNINSTNGSYTIQMARNEMEGCHFYLYHPQNKKITIKVSDFTNQYGETLKTELGVEFYVEEYYMNDKGFYENQSSYTGNTVEVYPDAVVPYESYIKSGYGSDEGGSYEYGTWVPIGPYTYRNVTREAIRGFTVTATTEKSSRPGKYQATVEIYDYETGKCIKKANVYTYVYDVVLAEETALDTAIGIWFENYWKVYSSVGGYSDTEVMRAMADFMLEYRMTPTFGGWWYENVFGTEWCYNPRVTSVRVASKSTYDTFKNDPVIADKMFYYGQDEPGVPRNQGRPITLEDGSSVNYHDTFGILAILGVAEEAKMLQNTWGWTDYRLLIPYERNPLLSNLSKYPDITKTTTLNLSWEKVEAALNSEGAKALYNKYKDEIQSSADMVEFMTNYVTVWTSIFTGFTPRALNSTVTGCLYMQDATLDATYDEYIDRMHKLQASGDELWTYVACEPQWYSAYQNILIFNDGTEARTMFWTTYKIGGTGFLYWREDYYPAVTTNTYTLRNPFSATGPGDGILFYPGAVYGQIDPIPSIRFMNMRDGIEDYQLLCMLEEALGEDKAMEIVENVVTSTVTFTRDDDKVYNTHAALLKLLEEAK